MARKSAKQTGAETNHGKAEMLHILGALLMHGHNIQSVSCDNHGSHALVKRMLLGQELSSEDKAMVEDNPFFGKLMFRNFPQTKMPRFPYRRPVLRGQCVWLNNGPHHNQKNAVNACRSSCRTIFVGEYWLDLSALRDTGLCPAAYCGLDSQSDKLAGMVCNPYLYIQVDEVTKELSVPFCLQGALLSLQFKHT